MINTIFSLFLLWMPGFIASEYLRYLKDEKRAYNLALLADTFIFSFVILGLNVIFKFIKGGAVEIFPLTEFPYNTSFLTKYIALSLVFSVLLPHIVQLFDILIKRLKSQKNGK